MGNKQVESYVELVETIADNKFILGDHLVEIGVSGPNLEATLSCIAMAQGELGHARLLYNWTFDLKGLSGKRQDVRQQTGKAFSSAVAVDNWISLLAAATAINIGTDIVLNAVFEARHSDVAARIHKLIKEQKEHIVYCKGWANQLLKDQGAVPRKFHEAFDASVKEVSDWLARTETNQALIEGGYMLAQAQLVSNFQQNVTVLLSQRTTSHV